MEAKGWVGLQTQERARCPSQEEETVGEGTWWGQCPQPSVPLSWVKGGRMKATEEQDSM